MTPISALADECLRAWKPGVTPDTHRLIIENLLLGASLSFGVPDPLFTDATGDFAGLLRPEIADKAADRWSPLDEEPEGALA